MKRFLMSSAAALAALIATPALAQDTAAASATGLRGAVTLGIGGDKIFDTDGETIGFELGYDWDLSNAVAGVAVQYDTDLGSGLFDANQTAVIGRVGGKIGGSNNLLYVAAGYTRVSLGATPFDTGGDGVRAAIGAEFAVAENLTIKLEQRYSNYEAGVELHQTVAGLGFRF
jgi:outer membrane immunogenic protein